MNNGRSNTTTKQLGGVTGKGFVKGDPRINRNGRPRNFDEVRNLAQSIAHETLTDNQGNRLSVIDAVLRSWVKSKDPTLQKAFMEYAFGKVPDKLEATGLEQKTILVLRYDHEQKQTDRDTGVSPAVSQRAD